MKKINKKIETSIGFKRFIKIAGPKLDPILMILKAHLLAEYYIDQLISLEIPRGDIIIDKGFSFSQKLTILKSLDVVKNDILDSLYSLNKLRNKCSHDMEYNISEVDIDHIGLPQRKDYFELKKEFANRKTKKELLNLTLIGIIAPLDGLLESSIKYHGLNKQNESK